MHIVTLISDFGNKGHRAAALKGRLLSANKSINIVDISHEVTPFDIDEAAFILRSALTYFPDKTIHIASVFTYYQQDNRIIFFEHENQYFIGPDNGMFSLVFERLDATIYTVQELGNNHYTTSISKIVAGITHNQPLDDIGQNIETYNQKLVLQPVIAPNEIRGSVIFVDRYGNITVNIKKQLFDNVCQERAFSLFFNRHDHIHTLSDHYMHVDIGSPLCNFNEQGFLEIAVNLQRADELLGIKKGDVIQIKFNS